MSYVFDVNEVTVWSPSLRVGDLYVRMMSDIADILSLPTGFSAVASDMYDIEIGTYEQLVHSMFDLYISTGHDILKGMLEGALLPSLVILERSGHGISPKSSAEADVISKALALSMAQ